MLAGDLDHRDLRPSAQQQAEGRTMMIGRSGSTTARLVLDL